MRISLLLCEVLTDRTWRKFYNKVDTNILSFYIQYKEYIWLLKSPQRSLVFFMLKKNEKKKMVYDYKYLNSWTIKNNYLLPLISNLINNIGKKKVFTKMNLR